MKKLIALPLILIAIVAAVAIVAYTKANSQPYPQDIEASLVPEYSEVLLDFGHRYASTSLPMAGSAVVDIDADGTPELFLGGGLGQDDGFFRFKNGAFEAIKGSAGVNKDAGEATYGAASVDVDQDGDADLFVARDSGLTLYTNNNGTFTGAKLDVDFDDKSTPLSFALGDLNADGKVDMFVSTYLPKAKMEGLNIFNKENYGANSLLLLNNGDNTFKDITKAAGMHYTHNTFQGVFVDMDDDLDLDIVVAHDTGVVKTWRNEGGLKFSDQPNPTSDVFGYPMGIAVGDYNNDGRVDFFFSNTGGTVPDFLGTGDLTDEQTFEDRLIFLRNEGDFRFTNVNEETKTAKFEFSWGTVFADLNLDGLQDLVISQNFVDFPLHKLFRLPGRVLIQKKDATFVATEGASGVENRNYEITALVADFSGDGYPDMVRVNLGGPARAFIHKGGPNHFLKVRLPPGPEALGAKVTVYRADGSTLTDWLLVGEGLVSDQYHVLSFGLGSDTTCKRVELLMMDGRTTSVENPKIDAELALAIPEAPQPDAAATQPAAAPTP